jgi:hypothetical protein
VEAREGKLLSSGSGEDAYEGQLFDELSRGLASGAISRRRALKLAGAAILGSTGLPSLFPGVAGAQSFVMYGRVVTAGAIGRGLCAEDEPGVSNRTCRANTCGGRASCGCAETVNGTKRCVNFRNAICPERDACDRNRGCPEGQVCIKAGGCCGHPRRNDCRPLCNAA